MIYFLLIVLFFASCAIGVQVMKVMQRRAAERQLRDKPPAQVRFIAQLPLDADKTNQRMTRFFERLHRLLPNDPALLKSQENVVHFALIGEGGDTGQSTIVRFVVWCHPQMADRVQSAMSECYDPDLLVKELPPEKDPLFVYAEQVRRKIAAADAQREAERAARQAECGADALDDVAPSDLPEDEASVEQKPRRARGLF